MNSQDISSVDIQHGNGTKFLESKFLVAELEDVVTGEKKTIIRANEDCLYYKQVFDMIRREAKKYGLSVTPKGGGKIVLEPEGKTIQIYGSSIQYGREKSRLRTWTLLRKAFPDFMVIADF